MYRWALFILITLYAQCNGLEYNGDDPKVDVGYIWYDGVEWLEGE